jgi:hypothetical protein
MTCRFLLKAKQPKEKVVGGGSATLVYIFIATIEVLGMALIIWLAWKWAKTEM